jgi:hypothetical protein
MKTLKKLTLGLFAAGVVTGSASAYTVPASVTVVHVAGSTAFRTAASIAIIDTLAGKTTASGSANKPVYAGYITSGKNVTNDSEAIFADGHIDGTSPVATTIVETNWTGSLTGVVDLVGGSSKTAFLNENDAATQAALSGSGAIIAAGSYANGAQITGYTLKSTGDTIQLAMSDSSKATIAKELATANLSGTIGSYSNIGALAAAVGSLPQDAGTVAAGAGTVGVVPFQWFLGAYSTAPSYVPTNISQQQAASLFTNGSLPQASFTGANNGGTDETTTFYLVGRNEDSGTRIGALAESQFGVTAAPTQYILGNDSSSFSGSWTVTTTTGPVSGSGVAPFPANTVLNYEPQISWSPAGHSGYNSGGNVQAALNIVSTGTNGIPANGDPFTAAAYFIGYLGLTDGNSAITGGANTAYALSYNGVAYSNKAVANGSYSFWTFEHAYRLSSGYTTGQSNVVNSIADNIYGRDADAIYSSSTGAVTYAEPTVGSGIYTEGTVAGKSAGNAGLLFDAGFTATRGLEGSPVISTF